MSTNNDGFQGRASPDVSPIRRTGGPAPQGPDEAPAPPRPRLNRYDDRVAMRSEPMSGPSMSRKSPVLFWLAVAIALGLAVWWFVK